MYPIFTKKLIALVTCSLVSNFLYPINFKTHFKTAVAPFGLTWKKVRQDFPTINLYFKSFYSNDYSFLYNLPKIQALKLISIDGKESFNYTINSSKDDYAIYLGNIPKGIY
jgi:hypothetical protein